MMCIFRSFLILAALLWALPADAASRFAVCVTACTWDASSTAMWSATSGGATGASVPASSDLVTFDAATCVGGVTCTITVNTTVNMSGGSITMGACTASTTGCILDFSVNNNNVNLGQFSNTGSGTRTLNMGNGTWTISIAGAGFFDMTTTTNLTFNANSSTLVFSLTSAGNSTFFPGAKTFNVVTVNQNTSGGALIFSGAWTATTLNISGPNCIELTGGNTTVTNAMNINGSSSAQIGFMTNAPGTQRNFVSAAAGHTFTWSAFRDIVFSGGGTFSATNSFDLGHNSGITITGPSGGGGSGGKIIGGYLLKRDLGHENDNAPMWLHAVG